jgi:HTH-type transcriptional regulator / antitoxin HigA
MTKIENEKQYKVLMERIEELLPLVAEDTPLTDKKLVELELLSNLAADYDEAHYPISVIQCRKQGTHPTL